MKRLRLIALAMIAGFGLSAALAQTINVPLVTTSHPLTDLIQIVPNGQPSAASIYSPWGNVTNVYGYYKNGTVTNNQLVQIGPNTSFVQFANASAMGNLYLYLPTAPQDGARDCFFSIGGVTAMTLYAGVTTATLNNAITAMTALTQYCYLYSASNTAWDRN